MYGMPKFIKDYYSYIAAIQQNGWGMGVEVVVVGNDIEMDTIGGDNCTL